MSWLAQLNDFKSIVRLCLENLLSVWKGKEEFAQCGLRYDLLQVTRLFLFDGI